MDEKQFEEKLEEITKKFEARLKETTDQMEQKLDSKLWVQQKVKRHRHSEQFWGIALLVVGLILLANRFDWFDWHLPLIPIALIVVGAYFIFANSDRD
jgi:uncharacterized membrane protein HdeD (DUF308 family)